jgi:hypothetical protein
MLNFRSYIYMYIECFIKNHVSVHKPFENSISVQGTLQKYFI